MDQPASPERTVCRLHIRGHLDPHWSAWFEGMTITHEPDGTTSLVGLMSDQAAIYGLLSRACDLGLVLLGVELLPPRTW
jgi:hypothetical protein